MADMQMRTLRPIPTEMQIREADNGEKRIEGYFAVFNSNYEIWDGMTESIAPGAFDSSISDDIRALVNHDTTLVLGRTKAHTLELRADERGLWGSVVINPNDADAMNLYSRVQRGDVDGCSIGFNILKQSTDYREDGTVHFTIEDVKLFEVSACTFPAYEETNITARSQERAVFIAARLEQRRAALKERIKSWQH